ncbi:MAG: rhamnulokinase [Peptostreptococcaceae bacterium]
MNYYLAIDIGASSGRHILSCFNNGKLELEEIYRFENGVKKIGNEYCWELDKLFLEIKNGIKECKKIGKIPKSIGIDTWAVDFVLLDENDNILGNTVSYRDDRTEGYMEKAFKKMSKEKIYEHTGIQFQRFNSLYQLLAIKDNDEEMLNKAKSFLMIPDYFNYLLTGKKCVEYTNATTTQLINAKTNNWDKEILDTFALNSKIFGEIKMPKTKLGSLKKELVEEFGFDIEVVLPATHDTGSAFMAAPVEEESIFVSSGTWSLLGLENDVAECGVDSLNYNFTNEGGYDYRFRLLKNIMGLWIIQEVRRCYDNKYSFAELVELARESSDFNSVVNVDDDRFLKPDNMVEEIKKYCKETLQSEPVNVGEMAYCVYNSLAQSYKRAIEELEAITQKEINHINIFGGGCQNELLNELIAKECNKEVLAGPVEATAIGNLVCQMIADGKISDLKEARKIIKASFDIKQYKAIMEGVL